MADSVRVLITGDSLTHGFSGDYTWRHHVSDQFTATKTPFDFVGPRTDVYGADPNGYLGSQNFDHDHAAQGGSTLSQHLTRITAYMETYHPDVVITMLGRNDLNVAYHRTPEDVATNMAAYIDAIRAVEPFTRIVIGQIPEVRSDQKATFHDTAPTDELLAAVVRERSTADSPVVLAHTNDGWNPDTMTSDGVHPTFAAQGFLAHRMAQALVALQVLPSAGTLYRTGPWDPHFKPTGVTAVSRTSVTIKWNRDRVRAWDVRVRLQGPTGRPRFLPGLHQGNGLKLRGLRPGTTYRIRLEPNRGAMTGVLGPEVRIRTAR